MSKQITSFSGLLFIYHLSISFINQSLNLICVQINNIQVKNYSDTKQSHKRNNQISKSKRQDTHIKRGQKLQDNINLY